MVLSNTISPSSFAKITAYPGRQIRATPDDMHGRGAAIAGDHRDPLIWRFPLKQPENRHSFSAKTEG
jgi:hypothetical protein